jgi:hypothetical protein
VTVGLPVASGAACLFLAAAAAAQVAARLEDLRVDESSGVAASRANPGLFWTHNESGGGAFLYAFGRDGRAWGRWRVRGARNVDWEDIAVGPGPQRGRWHLYIGDIGDNARRRDEIVVYRVEEPRIAGRGECKSACETAPATALRLRYPDGPHDAEALLVHPTNGDLYIVTKAGRGDPETRVYRARRREAEGKRATLSLIAKLPVPDSTYRMFAGGITGGDISPDGRRVVLSDYFRAWEAQSPAKAAFDDIWQRQFTVIPLGFGLQVEGVCYTADGKAIVATSEGRPAPVLEIATGP